VIYDSIPTGVVGFQFSNEIQGLIDTADHHAGLTAGSI